MARGVVQKKIPFCDPPGSGNGGVIETNEETGNEIELMPEIGQRNEGLDPPDDAGDLEQLREFAKHRHLVNIQPDSIVAQLATDISEIARATSEIENPSTLSIVQSKLADMPQADPDPLFEVQILRPVLSWVLDRVLTIDFAKPIALNTCDDSLGAERRTRD